jgi:hypothetical protein
MILCVISMFIYVCKCIGLHNIVIMMYMHFTMLYPINDLNLNLNLKINQIYNIKNVSALYNVLCPNCIVYPVIFFKCKTKHMVDKSYSYL